MLWINVDPIDQGKTTFLRKIWRTPQNSRFEYSIKKKLHLILIPISRESVYKRS